MANTPSTAQPIIATNEPDRTLEVLQIEPRVRKMNVDLWFQYTRKGFSDAVEAVNQALGDKAKAKRFLTAARKGMDDAVEALEKAVTKVGEGGIAHIRLVDCRDRAVALSTELDSGIGDAQAWVGKLNQLGNELQVTEAETKGAGEGKFVPPVIQPHPTDAPDAEPIVGRDIDKGGKFIKSTS